MLEVMQRFKPDVVFHAAAYKHVPLMEANPLEAVRNNAIATRVTAETAAAAGAERFVLISTDKAVNPRTVMGASKAMAEWIVEAAGRRHPAHPLRQRPLRQRARLVGQRRADLPQPDRARRPGHRHPPGDDPLLHDHPGGRAAGDPGGRPRRPASGEVFVLEMGEPVRILDLARNMITPRRLRARRRHRDRVHRAAARGEAPRGALQQRRAARSRRPRSGSSAPCGRARSTPTGSERSVDRLESLVASGDEAGLADRVVEVVEERVAESTLGPS